MANDAVIRLGLEVGELKAELAKVQGALKETAAAAGKSASKMDDSFGRLAQKQKLANLETKASIANIRQQGRAIESAAGEVAGMSAEMRKQTGIVDKLRAKADAAERELDKLFRDGRIDVKRYAEELKRLRGSLDRVEGLSGRATGAISRGWVAAGVAIGGAYAAVRTLQAGFRALDSAFETTAKVEGLRQGLENLAGDADRAEAALLAVQRATNGTVSEMEAMRIANTAMSFGIVENSEQLEDLANIGVTLGRSLGIDAEQAVGDLTLALSRQSPKILDNLGITLKLEEAYDIYAAQLGKSVEALTETEKQQAFLNAALVKGREKVAQLGGSIRTSADRWLSLKAAVEDARVEFSEAVTGSSEMRGAIEDLRTAIDENKDGLIAWGVAVASVIGKSVAFAVERLGEMKKAIDLATFGEVKVKDSDKDFVGDLLNKVKEAVSEARTYQAQIYEVERAQANMEIGAEEAALKIWGLSRSMAEAEARAEAFRERAREVNDRNEEIEASASDAAEEGDALAETFASLGKSAGDAGDGLDSASSEMDEAKKEAEALAEALAEITSSSARFAELAAQVGLVKQETADQLELLETLAQGAQDAEAALLRLWVDGKITAEQYNAQLAAILENEQAIQEQRSELIAGDRQGFVDMLTGGMGDPELQRTEGGALGQGGFQDFAQAELGAAEQQEQQGFEDEAGFSLMDVLKPGFDIDQALENWDLVTTAMQDGTMSLVDGQTQLAEAGFRVDGALQAQIKSMAKQGKAAQDVAKLNTMFGQAAAQAGGMLIDMAISGEFSAKRLLKATLDSISGMAKAEAVKELAAGFAAMARRDPGAALHFKSAAIWGGLAIASGIAAGAVGGGEAAGDREEREERQYGRDRDVARTQELADEDERGGPGVTVVIDGGNFIGTPDEEVARAISDIVEGAVADAAGGSSLRGG